MERPTFLNNHDRRPVTRKETVANLYPAVTEKIIDAAIGAEKQEPASRVEFSSWHRIERGEDGKIKALNEQKYGSEMQAQLDVEHGVVGTPPVSPQTLGAIASQIRPAQTAAQNVNQTSQIQPTVLPRTTNPLLQASGVVLSSPISQVDDSVVTAVTTSDEPGFNTGVSSQPHVMSTKALEVGTLTQDPEHMLAASYRSKFVTIVTSPWLWLVVGIGLIIWFI